MGRRGDAVKREKKAVSDVKDGCGKCNSGHSKGKAFFSHIHLFVHFTNELLHFFVKPCFSCSYFRLKETEI